MTGETPDPGSNDKDRSRKRGNVVLGSGGKESYSYPGVLGRFYDKPGDRIPQKERVGGQHKKDRLIVATQEPDSDQVRLFHLQGGTLVDATKARVENDFTGNITFPRAAADIEIGQPWAYFDEEGTQQTTGNVLSVSYEGTKMIPGADTSGMYHDDRFEHFDKLMVDALGGPSSGISQLEQVTSTIADVAQAHTFQEIGYGAVTAYADDGSIEHLDLTSTN